MIDNKKKDEGVSYATTLPSEAHATRTCEEDNFSVESVTFVMESGKTVRLDRKGPVALARIMRTSLCLSWTMARRLVLTAQQPTTTSIIEAIDVASRLEARLLAELHWCMTHPGPALPWPVSLTDSESYADQLPPREYRDALGEADLVNLQAAFATVNASGIIAISEARALGAVDRVLPLADGEAVAGLKSWPIGLTFLDALEPTTRDGGASEAEQNAKAPALKLMPAWEA